MINKEINTEVLINGAGVSGLTMACQLALHKIPFRIIEKKTEKENYSGAMIIHARSMEIFHQMGISLKFLKEGIIARRISFRINYKEPFSLNIVDFGNGVSLFPYVLIIEQWKTEKILSDFLREHNYAIEKGTALLSFSQSEGTVTSVLKKPDESGEIVTTRYLVGAGGSTSLVRRQLKVPFYGETHPELLFVSDCDANIEASYAEMIFTFTKRQTLGFFPLPDYRWRIDGSIPDMRNWDEKISFDEVEKFIENDKRLNLIMENPSWFSVFRSHSRYAPVFKHLNSFLIGDAAHVHTPVGAQGMNTGIQDASNLAWKLAFVLKGYANESILDSYQEERLPVAKEIIRYTDKVFLWIISQRKFISFIRLKVLPFLLRFVLPRLLKVNFLKCYFFKVISGTGINYRKSSISAPFKSIDFFDKAPRPGDRLPFIEYYIGNKVFNLQEQVPSNAFYLLVLGLSKIPDNIQKIVDKYEFIKAEAIPVQSGTSYIFKKMVTYKYACYLIRPDLHIAWRSDYIDIKGLQKYLRNYFILKHEFQRV